jgi:hypothetical protein
MRYQHPSPRARCGGHRRRWCPRHPHDGFRQAGRSCLFSAGVIRVKGHQPAGTCGGRRIMRPSAIPSWSFRVGLGDGARPRVSAKNASRTGDELAPVFGLRSARQERVSASGLVEHARPLDPLRFGLRSAATGCSAGNRRSSVWSAAGAAGFAAAVVIGVEDGEAGGCAAVVTAPGFGTFLEGEGCDEQGDGGVGPGPAECGVQHQADQEHRRQVGTDQGLLGVGDGGGGTELPAGAALGSATGPA